MTVPTNNQSKYFWITIGLVIIFLLIIFIYFDSHIHELKKKLEIAERYLHRVPDRDEVTHQIQNMLNAKNRKK